MIGHSSPDRQQKSIRITMQGDMRCGKEIPCHDGEMRCFLLEHRHYSRLTRKKNYKEQFERTNAETNQRLKSARLQGMGGQVC